MRSASGLRGSKVTAGHTCTSIIPAYIYFGRLNAVSSSITNWQLTVQTIPQLDTVNTTDPVEGEHSRIEVTPIVCTLLGIKLGRKRTVMHEQAIAIICSMLQSIVFTATAADWLNNTTTSQLRDLIVMPHSGYFLHGLASAESHVVWNLPLASPCLLCLVSLVVAPCWPDSVTASLHYELHGRTDEACEVISMLLDEPPRDDAVNISARFPNRTGTAIATQMSQQMKPVGMSCNLALLVSAVLFTCPFDVFNVDKAGRRKLHSFSVGTAISNNKAAANTTVAFIFLYVLFYVKGRIGPMYPYCSEIAPMAVHTQITGMSMASSEPRRVQHLRGKSFIKYVAINL
ncbi:hypothetical protein BDW71DRAFT_194027 [Aspergillus fruticulosus]